VKKVVAKGVRRLLRANEQVESIALTTDALYLFVWHIFYWFNWYLAKNEAFRDKKVVEESDNNTNWARYIRVNVKQGGKCKRNKKRECHS
jgi:hypothetical protein